MAESSSGAEKIPESGGVLLVYGGEPWQRNGGGVFLEQFSRVAGGRVVHLSIALDGKPHVAPDDWPWELLSLAARGPVRGLGLLRRISARLAALVEWAFVRPRQLRSEIGRRGEALQALGVARVVYFLNAIEVLQAAPQLNTLLGIPHSTMEWDLIDVAVSELPARAVRERLVRSAEQLRVEAVSRGVASEGMAVMYKTRWNLSSVVLRQTIGPVRPQAPVTRDAFTIALCGTMIVPVEFTAFLDALTLLDWRVDSRRLEFLWVGDPQEHYPLLPPHVRSTGWVSHARSLEFLASVDLGYSGLWFDAAKRPQVESSFPSKIISYLSAEVPVFYHGPSYGTPARFLDEFPAGFVCHTLEPAEIATAIQQIVRRPQSLRNAQEWARRAVAAEFTPEVLRQRTDELLGSSSRAPASEPASLA